MITDGPSIGQSTRLQHSTTTPSINDSANVLPPGQPVVHTAAGAHESPRDSPTSSSRQSNSDDGLQWSAARLPTLKTLDNIAYLVPAHLRQAVVAEAVPQTPMEQADCRDLPDDLITHTGGVLPIAEGARMFRTHVAPTAQAVSTRRNYGDHWRGFVTYAYLNDALHSILPTPTDMIQGYLWELLQHKYSPATVKLRLYAILDKNQQYGHNVAFSRRHINQWLTAYECLRGSPTKEKPAVSRLQLKRILQLPRSRLRHLRDTLIVALGCLCALRPQEIAQIDVCDLLFDHDGPRTLAIRIKKRKNDRKRNGLWPRVGLATKPQYDVITLARTWLDRTGREQHPDCDKTLHPRSSCQACGLLFSRIGPQGAHTHPTGHPRHSISNNTVTDAVRDSLERIGVPDAAAYSGKSLRAGALTTALAGGVPSDLYELQSGHRSDQWKKYIRGSEVKLLYRFQDSFGL